MNSLAVEEMDRDLRRPRPVNRPYRLPRRHHVPHDPELVAAVRRLREAMDGAPNPELRLAAQ
jgi:hypothetical protein